MSELTGEEKLFFDKLTKDREDSSKTFEKPAFRGVKKSFIEKFTDQAHFIYELLQNADDAKATQVNFILEAHGLYFVHNGSVHFSVSDPEKEEEDKTANKLGHINSITSIANSAKNEVNEASIGKFGVGFKAVFNYTNTPHIYDPKFKFKIENLIIPRLIKDELKDGISKNKTDTVFYFPFDKTDLLESIAYEEIFGKIKRLVYPTLFLTNLDKISWQSGGISGNYYQKVKKDKTRDGIIIQFLEVGYNECDIVDEEQLWLISKKIDNGIHACSVGFFLNKENKLKPVNHPAFCFFPTREKTGLKFIVHAPFLLTDSREGIRAGEAWNREMVKKLSDLSAESLLVLKEEKLIDDGIVDIIPYKETDFDDEDNPDCISYKPFYDSIKSILQTEELLPAKDGEYTRKEHAYWAESTDLCELFSNSQLAKITRDPDARWVFTSIGRKKGDALTQYIDGGDESSWIRRKPNLITSNYTPQKIFNAIDADFIQCQTFQWLNNLYEYLLERKSYRDHVKDKPIFIDANGKAVSAFEKNSNVLKLFLPVKEGSEFTTIHEGFVRNETSMKFFDSFGIKKPSLEDEIYNKILPLYDGDKYIDTAQHFRKIFNYYNECPNPKISSYLESLKKNEIIIYNKNKESFRGYPGEIYYPTPELLFYFDGNPETQFLDMEFYQKLINESEHETLEKFFKDLGISKLPRMYEKSVSAGDVGFPYAAQSLYDKKMDGCEDFLRRAMTKDRSILLWKILLLIIEKLRNADELKGIHKAGKWERFDSSLINLLKNNKWIITKNNAFAGPNDIYIDDLSDEYEKTSEAAKSLIQLLGIRDNSEKQKAAKLLGFDLAELNLIKNNPGSFKKWMEYEKNRAFASTKFPQTTISDPNPRIDSMAKKYADSVEKMYKTVEQNIRISSPLLEEKRIYLENWYTNEYDKMVCQICKKEMPFRISPDGKYYFEIREISISTKSEKSEITKETKEPYLALCPVCAAKYKVFVQTNPKKMSDICAEIKEAPYPADSKNTDIPIKLDKEETITFVAKHLIDLQAILGMESK